MKCTLHPTLIKSLTFSIMTSTATIYRVTEKDWVPGPAQYHVPGDFGNGLKYSIGHRQTSKSARGPGYENIPTTIGEGLKYSLSSRPKDQNKFVTPAPTYVPPSIGTGAPSSSFHQRTGGSARSVSPGPKYDVRPPNGGHQYTLKARRFWDEDGKPYSPGPGGYNPEYENVLPSPRRTQILNVIKRKEGNDTPGPKYEIDRSLASQPASFHQRIDMKKKDWVPGPGKYEPEKHQGTESPSYSPSYSLRSRIDTPQDVIKAPYQAVPSKIGEGLKYSLSSRPKDPKRQATPGPNYQPPKFGSDAIKCSLSSKYDRKRDSSTPGPGQYKVEVPNEGRKWTMKARNFKDGQKNVGPGSGAYMPNYEKVLPSARKSTILERFHQKKETPGPGYYDLGSTFSQPKITIGRKENLAVRPGVG